MARFARLPGCRLPSGGLDNKVQIARERLLESRRAPVALTNALTNSSTSVDFSRPASLSRSQNRIYEEVEETAADTGSRKMSRRSWPRSACLCANWLTIVSFPSVGNAGIRTVEWITRTN